MSAQKHFTTEQARKIGDTLGIDWSRLDVEQFRMGLDVELEVKQWMINLNRLNP